MLKLFGEFRPVTEDSTVCLIADYTLGWRLSCYRQTYYFIAVACVIVVVYFITCFHFSVSVGRISL